MKRRDLIRELVRAGCYLKRRGKRHDIYMNLRNGRKSPVPRHTAIRHTAIKESLCNVIRNQLGLR